MTITERLRLELVLREAHQKHGDEFFVELAKVLEKIQSEHEPIPPVGRFRMRIN
jgi:hypothetical protein